MDGSGNAYVTGWTDSSNFPTANPLQASKASPVYADAFVTKLTPSGAISYSTYLGGNGSDLGAAIAIDGSGSAYVTGPSYSTDFPTKDALGALFSGGGDTFVTKLTPAGQLAYSTYLGGSSGDAGFGIAVDGFGNVYVTGFTYSPNFPTKNAVEVLYAGNGDAFVVKLTPAGHISYATYLGGSDADIGSGIAVDPLGSVYVTGVTSSSNFPTKNALQGFKAGTGDVFVTKLSDSIVTISCLVLPPPINQTICP